jgi:hypothetical protein
MDVVEASSMHNCWHDSLAFRRAATPCGAIRDMQREVSAIVAGRDRGVNVDQRLGCMSTMYVSMDRLRLCCACLALLDSDRVRVT